MPNQEFIQISEPKEVVTVKAKRKPSMSELVKIEVPGKVKSDEKKPLKKKRASKKAEPSEDITLIITEKPQAAMKIAYALADTAPVERKVGQVTYYELNKDDKKIIVGCAVGHLFTLKETEKKKWPNFSLEWQPSYGKKGSEFTKRYYDVLKQLGKKASEFISATDYDTEGEVIGLNVLRFICNQKDAKRMKFSTLTKEDLNEAYKNIQPTLNWGQAYAGETRHYLDWFYGINLSRALMEAIKKAGSFRILSIGRVQGPTLALVVKKEKEIQSFKSEQYWQVSITLNDFESIIFRHPRNISKKEELEEFSKLKGKKGEAKTEKKDEKLMPLHPFDLTTLQVEAYRLFNITPARTLQIAQQLYLAGYISYPRTSSQKIPQSINYDKILKRLSKELTKFATRKAPVEGKKSDPAHPSIYPSGEIPSGLDRESEKIYALIVKRFISCFCGDAELENKTVKVIVEEKQFSAKGLIIKERGWLNVYDQRIEEREIPDINGEVTVKEVKIEEKETQPPHRYSEASLVSELSKRNLGTKCLTEDTKILFNGSIISMGELFSKGKFYAKEGENNIREITGKTISLNKKNPVITNSKLISKRKIRDNEKVIEIETYSSKIKLTEDHIVYVLKDGAIKQIPAKSLTINDKILGILKNHKEGKDILGKSIFDERFKKRNGEIVHKFSSNASKGIKEAKLPIKWSTALAWVLGYYYGDGSYSDPKYNGSQQVSFTTTEQKALSLLKANIKEVFGNEPYAYDLGGKYKVNCNGAMSYALINAFPSIDGKRPFEIPEEFIGDFLRGFFDADGNVHLRPLGITKIKGVSCKSYDTPRAKITLANEVLIKWVSDLLKKIRIENHINKGHSLCNGKKFDCWTILISGRDKIEKFAYKIGFDSYKEDILYNGLKCDSWKYKILKNSAKIILPLYKRENIQLKELIEETKLSKYETVMALRRLFRLGIINKKSPGQNKWVYSLKDPNEEYRIYCMKLLYKKIKDELYEIPIRAIKEVNYPGYVYDLSVEEDSPNFITEGNLLVHNSTRAAIIETLFKRGYLSDRQIRATQLGMTITDSLQKNCPLILDENLTRKFEKEMDSIQTSKKGKEEQSRIINEAKKVLIGISDTFRKNEMEIGKEILEAQKAVREEEKEAAKIVKCQKCEKGYLVIRRNKQGKQFLACNAYPECKTTFSLPPYGLIKKSEKMCECSWPILMTIRKGKRPWEFCANPQCPRRQNQASYKKESAAEDSEEAE